MMFVSGFSIIRNASKYGYPVVEAVSSILPLCDEFVLNVGASDDETLSLVKTIASPKLKILERSWDKSLRYGGHLISVESNHALSQCHGDWCFYIQADELLHEKYIPVVRRAMEQYLNDGRVEGLEFKYRHFYGSYNYYQDNYRRWYIRESRVIKRDANIISWGDGLNFRHRDGSVLRVKSINAEIYHYGWARPPHVMYTKSVGFHQLYYRTDEEVNRIVPAVEQTYNDLGHLKRFNDTHPAVMKERIAASHWDFDAQIDRQPPDWLRHIALFFEPLTKRARRLDIRSLLGFGRLTANGVDIAIFLFLIMFLLSSAFSIALTQIGHFSALILWLGRMAYKKQWNCPHIPLDWFLLLYVAAEVVATIFAFNRGQSLLYMQRRLLLLPIMYVLVANVRSMQQLRILVGAMIASALFVALWSSRDLLAHFTEYLLFQRRLEEFQIPMTAGGIMMIAMLVLLPFVFHVRTPRSVRLVGSLVMIPLGINLLFTFTRSSWLGFLAGTIVIGTMRFRRVFLPLVVGVTALVIVSSPAMKERMSSIFDPSHPNNITRVHMWETGWKMFKDYPIVGIGDIGTEQLWERYAQPEWQPEGHLHNNLVMWLVTLGIVGFIALSALFVKIWISMAHVERSVNENWFLGSLALGGLAVMAGFHVNGLFEWNFDDAEIIMLIWATIGLTLAAGKLPAAQGEV